MNDSAQLACNLKETSLSSRRMRFLRRESRLLLSGAMLRWQIMIISGARALIDFMTALELYWPVL